MTLTAAQLQADFPEFADSSTFPDSLLTLWLGVAGNLVNTDRWGGLATVGQELCAAHYLVLAARDQAGTGLPGGLQGLQTSKSVGDVSASYDLASVTAAGAGFWNQTNYGVRFWSLARLLGAGGIQLGCTGYYNGWPGVY